MRPLLRRTASAAMNRPNFGARPSGVGSGVHAGSRIWSSSAARMRPDSSQLAATERADTRGMRIEQASRWSPRPVGNRDGPRTDPALRGTTTMAPRPFMRGQQLRGERVGVHHDGRVGFPAMALAARRCDPRSLLGTARSRRPDTRNTGCTSAAAMSKRIPSVPMTATARDPTLSTGCAPPR